MSEAEGLEIDHVFLMIDRNGPEPDRLKRLGFFESYRRRHPGQGTSNICYCFDNLYLELLWLEDEREARSPAIARTRLAERGLMHAQSASPFGIAWRGASSAPVWRYRPPYLPPGAHIAVASESDDPRHPMLFRSPGSSPPEQWPDERSGKRQMRAGWSDVIEIALTLPRDVSAGPALRELVSQTILTISAGDSHRMDLAIRHAAGNSWTLSLPACEAAI